MMVDDNVNSVLVSSDKNMTSSERSPIPLAECKADIDFLMMYKVPQMIEQIVSQLLQKKPNKTSFFFEVMKTVETLRDESYEQWVIQVEKFKSNRWSQQELLNSRLTFIYPEMGRLKGYELKENGANTPVTEENLDEFLRVANTKIAAKIRPLDEVTGFDQGLSNSSPSSCSPDNTFSPTHFSVDLFSPKSNMPSWPTKSDRRITLPAKMVFEGENDASNKKLLDDKTAEANSDNSPVEVSPARLRDSIFAPDNPTKVRSTGNAKVPAAYGGSNVVDKHVLSFNRFHIDVRPLTTLEPFETVVALLQTSQFPTIESWEDLGITWCYQTSPGTIEELFPNGKNIPVAFIQREAYLSRVRKELDTLQKLQLAPAVEEPEDQERRQFSPTHFAKDLFAPHCTIHEVKMNEAKRRQTVADLREDYMPMIEELEKMEFNEETWNDMGITWCYYVGGKAVNLVDNGSNVYVQLTDKDYYCKRVRTELGGSRIRRLTAKRSCADLAPMRSSSISVPDGCPLSPSNDTPPNMQKEQFESEQPLSPLSPTSLENFGDMIKAIKDTPTTDASWEEMNLTWCVYVHAKNELVDLCPDGRSRDVKHSDKEMFCKIAIHYLETGQILETESLIKSLTKSDRVITFEEDTIVEEPHSLFTSNVTAFSELFDNEEESKLSMSQEGLQFWKVIDFLHLFDSSELEDLDITFIAPHPVTNEIVELIPNGKLVPVTFARRCEFVELAKEFYHDTMNEQSHAVILSPLSPKWATESYLSTIRKIELLDCPAIEFNTHDITWCVPICGKVKELRPGGKTSRLLLCWCTVLAALLKKVTFEEKHSWCHAARAAVEDAATGVVDQAYFFPEMPEPHPKQEEVFVEPFAPYALECEFYQFCAEMLSSNKIGLTKPEWDSMDMRYCIPLASGLIDLISQGSKTKVLFRDREKFFDLVYNYKSSSVKNKVVRQKLSFAAPLSSNSDVGLRDLLVQHNLCHLADELVAQDIETIDDLLELEIEDFRFVEKALPRRKLLNAIREYRRHLEGSPL